MASEERGETRTFMFTDIEGSTMLLQRLGRQRYGDLLATHDRLLRQIFSENHGQVLSTEGDSFFVVFHNATDSIRASLGVQRAVAAESWPSDVRLRVRIGVHSGEAVAARQSYFGIAVHRAARIGTAVHGGQVVISGATRALVEDDLPEGVTLRDLGEVKLKDITRPERLAQVLAPGLQRNFPALRGAQAVSAPPLRRRTLTFAVLAGTIAAAVAIPVFALGGSGGGGDQNGGAGSPAVLIKHSSGAWDSIYAGSNWHAFIGWETLGDVKSCTLGDNRGTPPKLVARTSGDAGRVLYPYGPYSHSVMTARISIRCQGYSRSAFDVQSALVNRPRGPLAQITIVGLAPEWLDAGQARWQLRVSWYSKDAVDCDISNNRDPVPRHRDPRGESSDPYGNFPASAENVTVTFTCQNIIGIVTTKTETVHPPNGG